MRSILTFLVLASPLAAAELKVGAAAVVITPPEGTPLAGYYNYRGTKSVLDDIYSKAIVLQVGDTKAALVVCDLISLPRHVVTEARRQIERGDENSRRERHDLGDAHAHRAGAEP